MATLKEKELVRDEEEVREEEDDTVSVKAPDPITPEEDEAAEEAVDHEEAKRLAALFTDRTLKDSLQNKAFIEKIAKRVAKIRAIERLRGKTFVDLSVKKQFGQEIKEYMATRTLTKAGWAEGTDSSGGYLVPEEISNEIDRLASLYGIVLSAADRRLTNRESYNIPIDNQQDEGAWFDEGSEITETGPSLGNTKLTLENWGRIVRVSNQLMEDSVVDLTDWITSKVAGAFTYKMEKEGLAGTGATTYKFTGALNGGTASTKTSTKAISSVTFANFIQTIGELSNEAIQGAAFYMSPSVWANVRLFRASTSGPYLVGDICRAPAVFLET